MPRLPLHLPAALLLALASPALADITYIGNGTVPDFPQIWLTDQKSRAICEAATAADVLWYWDQNGYAGLAKAGGVMPTPWRTDAQSLVFTMAKYIYGRDPASGNFSNLGQGATIAALTKYIKTQGMYVGQPAKGANGLVVDYYQNANATYTNWTNTINAGAVDMAGMAWRPENGGSIALHSMVSAGLDSDAKLLIVTHGWGDHPAETPPYKKPPVCRRRERLTSTNIRWPWTPTAAPRSPTPATNRWTCFSAINTAPPRACPWAISTPFIPKPKPKSK